MAYNGLTNAGAAYLAARQANNLPVEFLKAKVGNGIVPSGTDPADLTDIISEKMEVEITDIQQAERTLKMTVQVSNESLATGFYLTEIAIYVNDNGTSVLYWYIGKDDGTYVPDSTKPMKYKNILNIEVSSTPVTTVNYTGKDLWIDEEKLKKELEGIADLIKGNTGITTIKYIQDQGSKISGEIYWDKDVNPIVPYYCLTDTDSIVVTSDFMMVSNKALIEKNQKDEIVNLLKSNINGLGNTSIPELSNFRYGFVSWKISTSTTAITHDHYTAFFDTRLGYIWNSQQHILGTIRIGISGNTASITGTGGQYVTIISIYGVGLK
jgi:hypothetical protein|nr:MAG TPA: tail-collar fiber protein [Caudoviricetes sp.]